MAHLPCGGPCQDAHHFSHAAKCVCPIIIDVPGWQIRASNSRHIHLIQVMLLPTKAYTSVSIGFVVFVSPSQCLANEGKALDKAEWC